MVLILLGFGGQDEGGGLSHILAVGALDGSCVLMEMQSCCDIHGVRFINLRRLYYASMSSITRWFRKMFYSL